MEAQTVVRLQFAGYLRRYGRRFELEVSSAGEALRCLCYQIDGLKREINRGQFRVRVAGHDMTEDCIVAGLHTPLNDNDVITIVPVIGGAKSGGFLGIIGGAALIAGAFFIPGGFLATMTSTAMFAAGVGIAAAGVATMLTRTPGAPNFSEDNSESNQYFSSLSNRIGQGYPVPLCYGEMVVGSNVISQGLETV
ncbi:tail assembly protein [Morganella morganii]|uniref:tail assembly protein n=1 Tax=Morganella morganii TaxID=582 RepID=UPI001FFC865B|nr:tail assembly protein [Morganella morganii]